jgi:hypothetical protein
MFDLAILLTSKSPEFHAADPARLVGATNVKPDG